MSWSERLLTYRKNKKLSQEGLARELRISVMTVSRIERGKSRPSPMLREKFASVGLVE